MTAKVLLVEDDLGIQEALMEILADEGFEVKVAGNGVQALEKLAGDYTPQVILLDLAMPVMGGEETIRYLEKDERLKVIPVIVFSANYKQSENIKHAFSVVKKPVKTTELIAELKRACQ